MFKVFACIGVVAAYSAPEVNGAEFCVDFYNTDDCSDAPDRQCWSPTDCISDGGGSSHDICDDNLQGYAELQYDGVSDCSGTPSTDHYDIDGDCSGQQILNCQPNTIANKYHADLGKTIHRKPAMAKTKDTDDVRKPTKTKATDASAITNGAEYCADFYQTDDCSDQPDRTCWESNECISQASGGSAHKICDDNLGGYAVLRYDSDDCSGSPSTAHFDITGDCEDNDEIKRCEPDLKGRPIKPPGGH